MFLKQSNIFISKKSGEVTMFYTPFSRSFKTIFFKCTHTYAFVVIHYVNKKSYGWNLHFATIVKTTVHVPRTCGTSKPSLSNKTCFSAWDVEFLSSYNGCGDLNTWFIFFIILLSVLKAFLSTWLMKTVRFWNGLNLRDTDVL